MGCLKGHVGKFCRLFQTLSMKYLGSVFASSLHRLFIPTPNKYKGKDLYLGALLSGLDEISFSRSWIKEHCIKKKTCICRVLNIECVHVDKTGKAADKMLVIVGEFLKDFIWCDLYLETLISLQIQDDIAT